MKDLKPTQLLRLLAVAVLLSFLAACSDDDKPAYGTLDSLFQNATIRGCALACHEPGGSADGGPYLDKANFRAALVNKNIKDYSSWDFALTDKSCSDTSKPYITPNDPDLSSVLFVVSQKYGTSCDALGLHEPKNAVLEGAILDEFVTWIQNGAN